MMEMLCIYAQQKIVIQVLLVEYQLSPIDSILFVNSTQKVEIIHWLLGLKSAYYICCKDRSLSDLCFCCFLRG